MYMRDYDGASSSSEEQTPAIPAGYAGHIFDQRPNESAEDCVPPPPPCPPEKESSFLPRMRQRIGRWVEKSPISSEWLIVAAGVWLLCDDNGDDDLWLLLLLLFFIK